MFISEIRILRLAHLFINLAIQADMGGKVLNAIGFTKKFILLLSFLILT